MTIAFPSPSVAEVFPAALWGAPARLPATGATVGQGGAFWRRWRPQTVEHRRIALGRGARFLRVLVVTRHRRRAQG